MTEVPEHLLARSRARRAAMGGDGGGDTPAASTGDAGGAPAAAATPAVATAAAAPAPVEAAPPPPPPPYVQAALDRKRPPAYMGPVGVAILLWAFIYAGVMFTSDEISDPVLAQGGEIYAAQCAGCHGGTGQGGTGRPLHDLLQTFPDPADHIAWVTNGSPAAGTVYGANGHVSQDGWPAMPGFGNALSEEEIVAVVRYEREVMNGETGSALAEGGTEGGTDASTSAGGADADAEAGSQGDPSDSPTAEAESEGGDVGGDGTSGQDDNEPSEGGPSPEGDDEQLSEGDDTTDDSTPSDSGTNAEGESGTGE